MTENGSKAEKYHKLSIATAVFVFILMLGYYLISIFYTDSIISGLENIKEHPFPVAIAAGDMKANSLQIRLLTDRLGTDRSAEVFEEVKAGLAQNQENSRQALDILIDLYLTDTNATRKISTLYGEVVRHQETLLNMCRNSDATDESVKSFTKNTLSPLLDEIDHELALLIQNTTHKFGEFYGQSLSYRYTMLLLVTALGFAVIVALLIYQYILKRREEEAVALQKQVTKAAQAANEAKSKFLASMSHDIRTPMNAIIGMTAIARTRLKDEERVKDCLSKISTSSRHLLSLINDILDMSKIENGKISLNEDPVCLADFMHEFVSIIQPQVAAKQLELDLSILGIKDEIVIADSMRLHQIMQNIMSNAIKFTPEGGKISLRMEQKPCDANGYALYEFRFTDTGIGMSEAFQKVLFQPFERAASSTVSKTEGTGLGMSITKNIVDLMGGTISVHSKLNEGTAITISLPMRTKQQEIEVIPDLFKDLRSLVVDDDQDICVNTSGLLEEIGMKCEWALSGEEALTRVRSAHRQCRDYNVIIVDWMMPGMDGVETVRQIRAEVDDGIPIIILSAYDWVEIEEEARKAGVTAFLAKPLFKSRLYEVMCTSLLPEKKNTSKGEEAPSSPKVSGRVLLVEDNMLNAEIAEVLLSDSGVKVDSVSDGKKALDLIRTSAENYDIIFMDVQMPVMDGYQATMEIRRMEAEDARRHTIIVGMSANAFQEDIDKALSLGMDDYITKPIHMKELQRILVQYCK